jgi:hypothetical protein
MLRRAGWQPEHHQQLVGRRFVRDAFEAYARTCAETGGVFLVEGPSGVGKTALLTDWQRLLGSPAGYYFRHGARDLAAEMVATLSEQLGRHFRLELRDANTQGAPAGRFQRLLDRTAEKLGPKERLVVFIDALDEALDPGEAAACIPSTPPRGIFVIVSSRPAASARDHLRALRQAGYPPLDPTGSDNLGDLRDYFLDRLPGLLAADQAVRLAEATGGSFMLATLLVEAVQRGTFSVGDLLQKSLRWMELPPAQRLAENYRETWERITQRQGDRPDAAEHVEECLTEFLSLILAAQGLMGERTALNVLSLYEQREVKRKPRLWTVGAVPRVLKALTWFVKEIQEPGTRDAYVQIRHQSMRDWLTLEGPARLGVEKMHETIGAYFLGERRKVGKWERVEPYGRFNVVRHLLRSGRDEQARAAFELLTDLGYLQATLGDRPPSLTSGD